MALKARYSFVILLCLTVSLSSAQEPVIDVRPSNFIGEDTQVLEVCVSLPFPPETLPLIVSVNSTCSSATSGSDFVPIDTDLTFISPDEQCVDITIIDDNVKETIEFFSVNISPSNSSPQSTVILIQDNDVSVTFGFTLPSYTVPEGDSFSSAICVTALNTSFEGVPVAVSLSASSGSADIGADFLPPTAELIFDSTTSSNVGVCIPSGIIDDLEAEETEHFSLSIVPGFGVLASPDLGTTTVVIADDDGVEISFADENLFVTEDPGMNTTVDVCLFFTPPSGGVSRTIQVMLTTIDGTADTADFQSLSATLTFDPLELQVCQPVTIVGDNLSEDNETFTVFISPINSLDIVTGTDIVTITIIDHEDDSRYLPVDYITTIVECITVTVPITSKCSTPVVPNTPGPSSIGPPTTMIPTPTPIPGTTDPTPTDPTPTGPILIFPDPPCDCNDCVLVVYNRDNCRGTPRSIKWTSNDISILLYGSAAKSVRIDQGQCLWILYSKEDYAGFVDIAEPSSFCININDGVTSVRRLPPLGSISLALFNGINYEGEWRLLCRSYCDLELLDFSNKAESAIALGGDWDLYDGKEFKGFFGRLWVPNEGLKFPRLSDFNSQSPCRISSIGRPPQLLD